MYTMVLFLFNVIREIKEKKQTHPDVTQFGSKYPTGLLYEQSILSDLIIYTPAKNDFVVYSHYNWSNLV